MELAPTMANTAVTANSERRRIEQRREALGLPTLQDDPIGIAGLAISGGGIRSATLGLGVLESLAIAPRPSTDAVRQQDAGDSLLSRFDYLSTVSGGGYIGGFLCSLFVPGRLRKRESSNPPDHTDFKQAAKDAYETLKHTPPERLRRRDTLTSDTISHFPTAWLRENGRYLTPTGAGDSLYAAATALRNWISVHYVLGTLFLCAFAALALVRSVLACRIPDYHHIEVWLLGLARDSHQLWWSPLLGLIPVMIVAWLAPCGVAFWLSVPRRDGIESDAPRVFDRGSLAAFAAILLLCFPLWLPTIAPDLWAYWKLDVPVQIGALGLAAVVLLGLLLHVALTVRSDTITGYRVKTTQLAAKGIGWLLLLTVVAICDTGGQQLYLWLVGRTDPLKSLTPAAILGAIIWSVRKLAKLTDGTTQSTSILKKLPLDAISGVVGTLAFLLVGILWGALVQYLTWSGKLGVASINQESPIATQSAVLLITLLLALLSGRFTGFINLSTLQSIYGARLTRAYLGASNGRRFEAATSDTNSVDARRAGSVAEPLPGDQIELHTYYDSRSLAPLHIINVTVNQTIDVAEQLVQRDRKGKPLAVLPDGFSIDGGYFARTGSSDATASERMTVGQWIGTSGAAFTTGLGRATSVGASLALGLANVRLGTWWYSGQGVNNARGLEALFERLFRAQTYLLYELMARFHGRRRTLQYLSDGGHFENTALYELLRRVRDVRFLVMCDNGCDPMYRFEDLANLIRLARIDFRLNIEIDTRIAAHDKLKQVFGVPEDFKPADGPCASGDQCALLLNVFQCEQNSQQERPVARIVVLKPRVVASASADIRGYRAIHAAFPQQTTADQFFDEAQWESYRELGYRIGTLVFGNADRGGLGEALWEYLRQTRQVDSSAPAPAPAARA
jgi:hypothetical protein